MKRILIITLGLAAVISIGAISLRSESVNAQAPPEINMVAYGDAPGAVEGQRITAIVQSPLGSTTCGSGEIVLEGGNPKYVVRVKSQGGQAGCGANGRQVSFYLNPSGTTGGRFSTQSTAWVSGPKLVNLTFGPPLTPRAIIPLAARDGVFQ